MNSKMHCEKASTTTTGHMQIKSFLRPGYLGSTVIKSPCWSLLNERRGSFLLSASMGGAWGPFTNTRMATVFTSQQVGQRVGITPKQVPFSRLSCDPRERRRTGASFWLKNLDSR